MRTTMDIYKLWKAYENVHRRLGGEPNREIVSFRSCVRCEAVCERETMMFLSLGFETVNSPPRLVLGLAFSIWLVSSNLEFVNSLVRNEKWICEVVEPLWCLLCEFWSLLVSSGEVLMDFHEFSVSVPPCSFGPAVFVVSWFFRGF